MNTNRKTARIVGGLFLTAMVASLLGGSLIDAILSAPDYLTAVSENETQVILGVLLELTNAVAVVGIAVMMFPLLEQYNENIALGYLGFRIIEAVFCSVLVISPLALIPISEAYLTAGAADGAYFQTVGSLSIAARATVANLLILVFFSLSALLLYYSLFQTKLVPRFISIWGLVAVGLIVIINVLLLFNVAVSISVNMAFALPIILNEIFLGIWLIVKGFNPTTIASEPA